MNDSKNLMKDGLRRILAFTFKNEIQLNNEPENPITNGHLVAARKAKTLMYLQGLNGLPFF